jgi:hypothetical protein
MTIYWVQTDDNSALGAMEAVARALAANDQGEAPRATFAAPQAADVTAGDRYLADSLALLHATWPVDANRIVESQRPYLGWALNRFQHLARKATWWYSVPQWLQVEQFHGATVRTIDSILEHQRMLRERLHRLELALLIDRTEALEERMRALRQEHEQLLARLNELERTQIEL